MDILIRNGTIVDGSGSAKFVGDILINDETIKKIGRNLESSSSHVIDASNMVVSPGFIDMHSHADLTILQVNKAEPTIMQGVTTLVVGMCGLGSAPANRKVRDYYSGLDSLAFGVSIKLFNTLQDYMKEIEKKGISTNLAFFIPHGNVRISVLGLEDRNASNAELDTMKEIIKKDMGSGAFGLSTGLIYPPGVITPTEELIELSKIVSQYNGIYNSHMRNEGAGILNEGMGELIRIAKEANVQAHISHWKAGSNSVWKLTPKMIDLIKKSREEGLNIHADIYPYEAGSTNMALALLKPWVFENFTENLTNLESRKKIINEMLDILSSEFLPDNIKKDSIEKIKDGIYGYLKHYFRIISVLHNCNIEGMKLGYALEFLYPKKNFEEAMLDLMKDEEGSIMISLKTMSERKSIISLFKQDFVCIGSDGFLINNKNTHPRSYGTFPRILNRYVRNKKIVSFEEGIRKMTSLPASILGLKDRGYIKEKYKADIVIFNPDEIKDKATYKHSNQYPEGILYVIVNGKITVENGKHIGVLNGQILKHLIK